MSDRATPAPLLAPASGAEKLFVVFVLVLSAGAFQSLWMAPEQAQRAAGTLLMQVLWTLIYGVTMYLFLRHCKQPLRRLFSAWPLVVLCAFAMASIFWSQAPGLTFRRSVALSLTLLFGVYLVSRFSLKEQLRLLVWTCWVCIIFSFIFGVLGLGTSVDAGQGVPGWYGIFVQKNGLGRMMALSVLTFIFWKRVEPERKWLANAGLLGSIALVALSRSMTAVLVLAMLLGLSPYLRWMVRKSTRRMVASAALLAVAGMATLLYVATHMEQVTGLLGKSATLTGRIQLWILSFVMALRRPWFGYGYNAFWSQNQIDTVRIWRVVGWTAPNAHNGFLEVWLELGSVGLALLLLVFCYYVVCSLKFLRERRGVGAAAWPVIFLVFNLITNLTEVDFLSRNSFFFILFVASALATQPGLSYVSEPRVANTLRQSMA